jgi:putative hydroxymethylpyrimidine transport system substrate-binding protein
MTALAAALIARLGAARVTRLAVALTGLLGVSLLAIGCGEKEEPRRGGEPEQFDLALDFYVNPDHVGIYEAIERGYFTEAGLDVKPRVPSDPSAPIKQVAAGQVDLAISYEPEVLIARDEGLDVVAVGALVQEPLTSLISLGEERIDSVERLEGKTVATAGIPYQTAFLEAMLRDAALSPADVSQVDVGLNLLPAVLSGRADAMLGGFKNVEGVDLELRGEEPVVVPVDELGIPTYDELVLVAGGERVADDPEAIRLFLAALERGTADAVADPEGATERLLEAAPDLDPRLTAAEVEATLPLLRPERGDPYGYMDVGQWQRFAGFMTDEGLIDVLPEADDVLTNELLPEGSSD